MEMAYGENFDAIKAHRPMLSEPAFILITQG